MVTGGPSSRRRFSVGMAVRLAVNGIIPALVYLMLQPRVHSDVTALIIGSAIPVACTAGHLLWRRRLDPVGVMAVTCFGIGLLVAVATGGSELAFKLREVMVTGPLGLACLISVAVHRPLFLMAMRCAARRNQVVARRIRDPVIRRRAGLVTALAGALLVVHAVVMVILALTVSTAAYLAVSKAVGYAVLAAGAGVLVLRHRHPRGTGSAPR
jgi:hypothetical protein